ncbi:hypothetical protein [Arvimicrobium flavum]|uniref:hypothetical protein n=1 Tax=Arvimicrobium flavum TaxID=3393320 RepID=UPI00237AB5CD|nr:hypothetical protein [Mesorhizobium shangrilense]
MFSTYLRLDITVHDNWRSVVRAARTRIAPETRRDPALRDRRKHFYRAMLAHHADAQHLVHLWRL